MMDLTGFGILATAAILGITHGFEPDHAAGISALTTDADDWTHAAFVGGCFAAGHVIVVLAWVAVLTAIGRASSEVPAVFDTAGSMLAGGILVGVAFLLAATGTQRLRGMSLHSEAAEETGAVGRTVSHAHTYLHHSHEGRGGYLRTGVIGSLFALSPPVSMLALVSTVIPIGGLSSAVTAVGIYAVTILTTMALVGSGIGSLFSRVQGQGRRLHAAFELLTSVLVLGFAIRLLF